MGRNTELIRQWTILQRIATARGQTIPKLATDLSVSTRTIRRDLEALQVAGFPVYDEIVHGDKFWRLDPRAMGALARTGVTLTELAALYFSRALIECFAGTGLRKDITSVFDKLEAVLSPAMKKFLDRLPRVISAKHEHAKRQGAHTYEITARLLDAILGQRVISMQYHSLESRRQKLYTVHPSRLIHAQGGLYLIAFVPAYAEVRTFAVERISKASVQETTFEPIAELDTDPFKNSLGVHRGGPTCKVRLRFHPQIAPVVKERTWHASQQFDDRTDGSIGHDARRHRRLRVEELDPGLRAVCEGAGACAAGQLGGRRAGRGTPAVRVGWRGGRQRCSAAAAVPVAAPRERMIPGCSTALCDVRRPPRSRAAARRRTRAPS